MNEKMKKTVSNLRSTCYLLPCFFLAGGAVFAGTGTVSEPTTITLDSYDISKIEEALKSQENSQNLTTTFVSSASKSTLNENTKSSQHGEAQSFVDGTYEGVGVGFAGQIKVKVVVKNSKIVSVEVIEVEADDAPFVAKAKGVIASILQYQTWEVDTISGATYSSRGILGAVRNALEGVEDTSETAPQKGKPAPTALPAFGDSEYEDGVYYGTGTGFGGEVKVKVTIADGKITEITIESASGEDGSYLAKAKTLIEKVIEKQSPNVDTVSGATYTSNGIISAIQNALSQAKKDGADTDTTKTPTPTKKASSQKETTSNTGYQNGTYVGTAKGFRGETRATVTIKNKKISKIVIDSKDDEPFLSKAKTLVSTIIQKQTPEGIDVVSGATYSSNGILNAVKAALKNATGNTQTNSVTPTPSPAATATPVPTPVTISDSTPSGEEISDSLYRDGTYQAQALGFSDYVVTEVVIQNGSISKITIKDYKDDDEFFWDAYNGVSAQILRNQNADGIDVVSGATYSSEGIINAVKKALEQAKK